MRTFGHIFITSLAPAIFAVSVHADVPSEHGLDALIARIGIENVPTGAGVEVAQVEAANESDNYAPDANNSALIGKTFTLRSGSSGVLNHATQVGKRMYGTDGVGLAPGVTDINVYSAVGWTQSNYLRFGTGSNPSTPPGNIELFNNSWVASFGNFGYDNEVLARGDWAIDAHNVMMLNGVTNADEHAPLMCFAFNCVSVGASDGTHTSGTVPTGYHQAGMQVPLIVAAQGTTSNATGVVSAITALLVETRETHPNTSGNFFAGFSETMKAVLLTGGNHSNSWTNNPILSGPNRGRTNQPIDAIYGVGTANIDNSHRVLTGGQFASDTSTVGLGSAPTAGWDTTTLTNGQSKYIKFSVASLADEVSIVLTWHQQANTGFGSYSLADLNLELLHYNGGKPTSLTGDAGIGVFGSGNCISESEIDTVEHLYLKNLSAGEYVVKMSRSDSAAGARVCSLGWLFPEQDASVPGDLNGDGTVDVNDLLVIIAGWGVCSGECPADLSGDGLVDVSDILLLLSYWS
ncbi:MAG: dockerin type I domain-containing protein [Phycisphaerales bacterium]